MFPTEGPVYEHKDVQGQAGMRNDEKLRGWKAELQYGVGKGDRSRTEATLRSIF